MLDVLLSKNRALFAVTIFLVLSSSIVVFNLPFVLSIIASGLAVYFLQSKSPDWSYSKVSGLLGSSILLVVGTYALRDFTLAFYISLGLSIGWISHWFGATLIRWR